MEPASSSALGGSQGPSPIETIVSTTGLPGSVWGAILPIKTGYRYESIHSGPDIEREHRLIDKRDWALISERIICALETLSPAQVLGQGVLVQVSVNCTAMVSIAEAASIFLGPHRSNHLWLLLT